MALSGKKKSKSKSSNLSEKSHSDCAEETTQTTRSHAPLIAKWRNGVKLQLPGRFDGDGKFLIYFDNSINFNLLVLLILIFFIFRIVRGIEKSSKITFRGSKRNGDKF